MDGIRPDVTAFILAGGKSTRMGTDKAFVPLHGRTLLERALEVARAVTPDVRVVGDPTKFSTFAPVVEDLFPGCGPIDRSDATEPAPPPRCVSRAAEQSCRRA